MHAAGTSLLARPCDEQHSDGLVFATISEEGVQPALGKITVLKVREDSVELGALEEFLARPSFEVHPVARARTAMLLARNLDYGLIVAAYPLPDMGLRVFIDGLRRADSSSSETPLLVVGRHSLIDRARREGQGRLQSFLERDADPEELNKALKEAQGIARRANRRLLVHLDAQLAGQRVTRLVQTFDISESGMLLRTGHPLPVGSRLAVRLTLPDDPQTVDAQVEVVRHARKDLEAGAGMGVRFLDLRPDGQARLRQLVHEPQGSHPPVY